MTSLFDKAKIIAEKVHANQVDKKGYPYMSHVVDIAIRVSHIGESYQIVGLLHDAIEDAEPKSFRSEITKEIESTFNIEIINAIKAMTKVSTRPVCSVVSKSRKLRITDGSCMASMMYPETNLMTISVIVLSCSVLTFLNADLRLGSNLNCVVGVVIGVPVVIDLHNVYIRNRYTYIWHN